MSYNLIRARNLRIAEPYRNSKENGVILILLALLLVTLLLLIAIVVNTGFSRVVSGELQNAADAAALAGASTLCSARACYQDALEAVVKTLNKHSVHGSIGTGATTFNLSTALGAGPQWTQGNLRITVQRGRWWPNGMPEDSSTFFETFDRLSGSSWQSAHPGVPQFVASNAVRVQIEASQYKMGVFGPDVGEYELMAESIAIGGEIEQVKVAPFALHVCALLDQKGEFSARANCTYDRFFTRADRYCVDENDDDDCGVIPDTQWYWRRMAGCEATVIDPDWMCRPLGTCVPNDCPAGSDYDFVGNNNACGFYMHRFNNVADNFGLVGMPVGDNGAAADEAAIRAKLEADPLDIWAQIGDRFRVLDNGFEESATNEAIWKLIAPASTEWSDDLTYQERQALRESVIDDEHHITPSPDSPYMSGWTVGYRGTTECGCLDPTKSPTTTWEWTDQGLVSTPACEGGPKYQPPAIGLCNSTRNTAMWRIAGEPWRHGDDASSGICAAFPFDRAMGLVWQIRIPVIADNGSGASSCQGLLGSTKDPTINPASLYTIIGFVNMHFIDVDIGNPFPSAPVMAPEVNTSFFPCHLPGQIGDDWGLDVEGLSGCNLVRGYTTCDIKLIPTSKVHGLTRARLVS